MRKRRLSPNRRHGNRNTAAPMARDADHQAAPEAGAREQAAAEAGAEQQRRAQQRRSPTASVSGRPRHRPPSANMDIEEGLAELEGTAGRTARKLTTSA